MAQVLYLPRALPCSGLQNSLLVHEWHQAGSHLSSLPPGADIHRGSHWINCLTTNERDAQIEGDLAANLLTDNPQFDNRLI